MIDFVKCQNCGGILENGKCPFCGADYNNAGELKAKFESDKISGMGTLELHGQKFKVYLANIKRHAIGGDMVRDVRGKLCRTPITYIHEFTLIEH